MGDIDLIPQAETKNPSYKSIDYIDTTSTCYY